MRHGGSASGARPYCAHDFDRALPGHFQGSYWAVTKSPCAAGGTRICQPERQRRISRGPREMLRPPPASARQCQGTMQQPQGMLTASVLTGHLLVWYNPERTGFSIVWLGTTIASQPQPQHKGRTRPSAERVTHGANEGTGRWRNTVSGGRLQSVWRWPCGMVYRRLGRMDAFGWGHRLALTRKEVVR